MSWQQIVATITRNNGSMLRYCTIYAEFRPEVIANVVSVAFCEAREMVPYHGNHALT